MMSAQLLRGALPAADCARWLAATAPHDGVSRTLPGLAGLPADEVLRAVAASALCAPLEQRLGPAPLCNLDQSWLRHGRPPHHWHQDGALRFDFTAHADGPLPEGALLEMLTCWIALTPCGDTAPGLEWVDAAQPALLRPAELTDAAVAARHPAAPRLRPCLQPGDALLFDGSLLHRTHLAPHMTQPRSSLELRFVPAGAVPARLAADRCASLR